MPTIFHPTLVLAEEYGEANKRPTFRLVGVEHTYYFSYGEKRDMWYGYVDIDPTHYHEPQPTSNSFMIRAAQEIEAMLAYVQTLQNRELLGGDEFLRLCTNNYRIYKITNLLTH